ncbi:response regulator transcription factor [Yoonia sp.]|uniref:response regulator n=1 Tax=Yoonia sp. TaxID=2212373 RepID=UPI0025D4D76D|nr:response regulator transcription factor [Yoonia sp.]
MPDTNILVVDDDPKIRTLLRRCLEGEGYHVHEASDLASTLAMVKTVQPDLVTLDLQLGSDDGFDIARQIRTFSQVPIIMVTGKDDVIDRVVGLEIGADDYITKPFHLREVVARLKSVLRRAQQAHFAADDTPPAKDPAKVLCFDGLKVTLDRFALIGRDDSPIELTSGEFKLLRVFLERPKRTLSREMLMDKVGGIEWAPLDRTIDNQVARLRKKIERDPAHPRLISTVRGIGYAFSCEVTRANDQSPANMD